VPGEGSVNEICVRRFAGRSRRARPTCFEDITLRKGAEESAHLLGNLGGIGKGLADFLAQRFTVVPGTGGRNSAKYGWK